MKRYAYYFCFTLLGALAGFFLHMVIELNYLRFLLADFGRYGLGWTWSAWEQAHFYGTWALTAGGAAAGYRAAVRCWQWLYVEKRYLRRWGVELKENF